MSGLPTVVPGRPEDLADAAGWLRRIARGDERFGDDAVAARALFARAWEGEAEEAFRSRADLMIRAADRLAPIVAEIADEVDGLGRSLHATQLGMLALRADAVRGGHAVTETGIVWSATPADVLMDHDLRLVWAQLEERHRQLLETWQAAQEQGARVLQEHAVLLADAVESLAFGDRAGSLQHRFAETMATTAAVLQADVALVGHGEIPQAVGDGAPGDFARELTYALGRETADHYTDAAEQAGHRVPRSVNLGLGIADAAMVPLGVALDMESGESWGQAVTSQSLAALAGLMGSAAGGAAGALAGPPGRIVGAAVVGTLVASRADEAVDRRMSDEQGASPPQEQEESTSGAAIKRLILDVTSGAPAGGRDGR